MKLIYNKTIIWLLGLHILAVGIFYFGYSRLSLRLDESQSLWQTSHSMRELLDSLSRNVHVPLYHTTIHYWQIVWGNGVVAGRVYSLIFFLVSIGLIYYMGKKIFDERTGLIAATLLTLSPFMNWYASEIRMYTLLVCLTIGIHTIFMQLIREPRRVLWICYVGLAIVGMYTHYFFAFNLLSHGIYVLSTVRTPSFMSRFKRFCTAGVVVICAFVPWIYKVATSEKSLGSSPLLSAPTSVDFFNVFSQFLFGFQIDYINSIILSLWPFVFIILLISIRKHVALSEESKFLIIAFLVPILVAFAVSMSLTPVFLSRYLIIVLPAIYLLTARVIVTLPSYSSLIVRTALYVGMVSMLFIQLYNPDTPTREKFNDVGAYLSTHVTGRDIVVLSAPFLVYPIDYYYKGPASIQTLPQWDRYSGEELPPFDAEALPYEIEDIRTNRERVFLVLGYDQGYEGVIKKYLDSRFPLIEEHVFSKGLTVRVYKTRFYDPFLSFTTAVPAFESSL